MAGVSLVDDRAALLSMRNSDFDAYSAVGEVIDNSIQAEARNVRLSVAFSADRHEPITAIAFGDDGMGMSGVILHRCLQLGYSTRYNDRRGIGRFGVGATLAAISQCRKIEVSSKEESGPWLYTYIDLDAITADPPTMKQIPPPTQRAVPEALRALVGPASGTLVVKVTNDANAAVVADGHRSPANVFSLAGVAGYTDQQKQDALEGRFRPDVVFSIFGPTYKIFRCPHLMGFAVGWITHPNSHAWHTLRNPVRRARHWAWCKYVAFWARFADRWREGYAPSMNKVRKGLNYQGPAFLHIHCPCPKGWLFDCKDTVKVAKQAVETGMWTNYEWENGEYTYQHIPKAYKPVKEYMKNQERFNHLNEEHIAKMQAFITAKTKAPGKPIEVPVLGPREQA